MQSSANIGWHPSSEAIGEHSRNLLFHNNAERKRLEKNVEVIRRGHERIMRGYDAEIVQMRREIRDYRHSSPNKEHYVDQNTKKSKDHNTRASLRRRYIVSRNQGSSSGSRVKVRDYINQTRHSQQQRTEVSKNDEHDKQVSAEDVESVGVETPMLPADDAAADDIEADGEDKEHRDLEDTVHLPFVIGEGHERRERSETNITDVVEALSSLPPVPKSDRGIISDYEYHLRMKVDPLVLTRRRLQQNMAEKSNGKYHITPMIRSIEHFSFMERQNSSRARDEDVLSDNDDMTMMPMMPRRRGGGGNNKKLPSWELAKMRTETQSLPPLLFKKLSNMTDKDLQDDLRKVRSASFLSDSTSSEQVSYLPMPAMTNPTETGGGGSTGGNNMAVYLKMAIRFRMKFGQARHSSQRVTSRQLRRGWGNSIQEEPTSSVLNVT